MADALRVHLLAEPVSLDPSLAEDGVSLKILANTHDGLVGYDGAGKFAPLLAESYTVSKSGTRYEFKLRPGTVWSDGVPVKAADFIFGIRRSLLPTSSGKIAALLFPIQGAKEFNSGKTTELPSVREENGKLVIELSEPTPSFVGALALSVGYPQREDVLKGMNGKWPAGNTISEMPVTGAYRMTLHEADARIVLEANPKYWGGKPPISKIELVIVKDETTAVHLFEQGRLDILSRVPALEFDRLKKKGFVRTDPFNATYFLSFNCQKEPFDNRDWRRAVAASIERMELASLLNGGDAPARSWIPRGIEGALPFDPQAIRYEDSVAKVKELAPKHAPVTIGFDSSSRNATILEKVQADLKRNLGLRSTLNSSDWKTYVQSLKTEPAQIWRFGWLAPYDDPVTHLLVFTTGNPNNASRCSFPEYDELVEKISHLKTGPEREKLIQKAQAIIVDQEAVVVPLMHYAQTTGVGKRLHGFRVNAYGVTLFKEMRLGP